APRAIRIPNSRRRLLTEYAANPKMPVTDNIAPITPRTPSETAAIREGNRAPSIASVQVWMKIGRPESVSCNLVLMAADSRRGLALERTTSHVSVEGDWRMGRNI